MPQPAMTLSTREYKTNFPGLPTEFSAGSGVAAATPAILPAAILPAVTVGFAADKKTTERPKGRETVTDPANSDHTG